MLMNIAKIIEKADQLEVGNVFIVEDKKDDEYNAFTISKIDYLDSAILVIGGFENHTECYNLGTDEFNRDKSEIECNKGDDFYTFITSYFNDYNYKENDIFEISENKEISINTTIE